MVYYYNKITRESGLPNFNGVSLELEKIGL